MLKKTLFIILILTFLAGTAFNAKRGNVMHGQDLNSNSIDPKRPISDVTYQRAVFAAGCFWGVEDVFKDFNGVVSTTCGYTGGTFKNPTYRDVCTGKTGHAEAILVEFNPKIVKYERLVELFFQMHDPTTLNRQGPDIGTQYRSAIFYFSEQQKAIASLSIKLENFSGRHKLPIMTTVESGTIFYPAEKYHQDYFVTHPAAKLHSCHLPPKKSDISVKKTDEQWKEELSPLQYNVARKQATEPAFSGKYDKFFNPGKYTCVGCGAELFSSGAKFDSGCGWPAFFEQSGKNVTARIDTSHNMLRVEVLCKKCGAHLGHLFEDAPQTPTGLRYCINSASMEFENK